MAVGTNGGAIGFVAGSGIDLVPLLDTIVKRVSFGDLSGLFAPSVEGHDGEFLVGRCGRTPLIVQRGRLHFYEGYHFGEVTRTVDALAEMGVVTVVFTNAAGGLRESLAPGAILAATRIETLRCARWDYQPASFCPSFVLDGADGSGTYCWVPGPNYETRAEIGMLQSRGADAVGMSTAPELLRCQQLGIAAGALSCITNNCLSPQKLSHTEVVSVASQASERLCRILRAWIGGGAYWGG